MILSSKQSRTDTVEFQHGVSLLPASREAKFIRTSMIFSSIVEFYLDIKKELKRVYNIC